MKDPVKNVEDHPNAMHEVLDGFLFQGNGMAGVSKRLQVASGVTAIVNVTKEISSRKSLKHISKKNYLQIKVVDVPHARDALAAELSSSSDFIAKQKEKNGKVLVHCAMGISRSSTVTLAYLVTKEGFSLKEAWLLLKTRRPIAAPNNGFWQALIELEEKTRGVASVKMIEVGSGYLLPSCYADAMPS